MTPTSPEEVAAYVQECLGAARSVAISGAGSKAAFGDPVTADCTLSTMRLTGIEFYEPEELVMRVRSGTPMADVTAALDAAGQMFAFEPGYLGTSSGTIGGLIATDANGPRRIAGGAVRDSMMGLEIVTGRGEVIRSGGRVMKNVTGFDLVKLAPGSRGTLGCVTSVTLQTTPKPEAVRTLVVPVRDLAEAVDAMRAMRRIEPQPTGLAWLPAGLAQMPGVGDRAAILARIEGFVASIDAKTARFAEALPLKAADCLDDDASGLWQSLADARPAAEAAYLLCASVPPSAGAAAADLLPGEARWIDWGGGRVWAGTSQLTASGLEEMRAGIADLGGSLRLVRAPETARGTMPALHPQPGALAALQKRVREAFDPRCLLNPRGMIFTTQGAA